MGWFTKKVNEPSVASRAPDRVAVQLIELPPRQFAEDNHAAEMVYQAFQGMPLIYGFYGPDDLDAGFEELRRRVPAFNRASAMGWFGCVNGEENLPWALLRGPNFSGYLFFNMPGAPRAELTQMTLSFLESAPRPPWRNIDGGSGMWDEPVARAVAAGWTRPVSDIPALAESPTPLLTAELRSALADLGWRSGPSDGLAAVLPANETRTQLVFLIPTDDQMLLTSIVARGVRGRVPEPLATYDLRKPTRALHYEEDGDLVMVTEDISGMDSVMLIALEAMVFADLADSLEQLLSSSDVE